MDAPGINWSLLLSQLVCCVIMPVGIGFLAFRVRNSKPSSSFASLIGFLTALITGLSILFVLAWVVFFVLGILKPSVGFESSFTFYGSDLVQFLAMVTIVGMFILWAYYIPHVARSPLIPDSDRVYYQIAFLLLPIIMMPMYYFKYIKNAPSIVQKA